MDAQKPPCWGCLQTSIRYQPGEYCRSSRVAILKTRLFPRKECRPHRLLGSKAPLEGSWNLPAALPLRMGLVYFKKLELHWKTHVTQPRPRDNDAVAVWAEVTLLPPVSVPGGERLLSPSCLLWWLRHATSRGDFICFLCWLTQVCSPTLSPVARVAPKHHSSSLGLPGMVGLSRWHHCWSHLLLLTLLAEGHWESALCLLSPLEKSYFPPSKTKEHL